MKMLMICILNILNKVQFVKTYKKALNKISDLLRLKWTSWFLFIRVIPDKKATQIFIKIMTQYTYHHKILWLNKLPKIIMHLKNLPVTLTSLSLPQSSNSLSHCALLPCINCILFKRVELHTGLRNGKSSSLKCLGRTLIPWNTLTIPFKINHPVYLSNKRIPTIILLGEIFQAMRSYEIPSVYFQNLFFKFLIL